MAGSHETLHKVTQDVVRELAEKMVQLSQLTHKELLRNDGSSSLAEVLAALALIRRFAGVEEETLRESGGIIFPHQEETHPSADEKLETGVATEAKKEQPKTFTELLRRRIREALPEQEAFAGNDLIKFLDNKSGTKRVITSLNWQDQKVFTKEQAVIIITGVLTTPRSNFRPKETYTSGTLLPGFGVHKNELDEWSRIIGYNWKKHPTIGLDEALATRGLNTLEKMMSGKTK